MKVVLTRTVKRGISSRYIDINSIEDLINIIKEDGAIMLLKL